MERKTGRRKQTLRFQEGVNKVHCTKVFNTAKPAKNVAVRWKVSECQPATLKPCIWLAPGQTGPTAEQGRQARLKYAMERSCTELPKEKGALNIYWLDSGNSFKIVITATLHFVVMSGWLQHPEDVPSGSAMTIKASYVLKLQ